MVLGIEESPALGAVLGDNVRGADMGAGALTAPDFVGGGRLLKVGSGRETDGAGLIIRLPVGGTGGNSRVELRLSRPAVAGWLADRAGAGDVD